MNNSGKFKEISSTSFYYIITPNKTNLGLAKSLDYFRKNPNRGSKTWNLQEYWRKGKKFQGSSKKEVEFPGMLKKIMWNFNSQWVLFFLTLVFKVKERSASLSNIQGWSFFSPEFSRVKWLSPSLCLGFLWTSPLMEFLCGDPSSTLHVHNSMKICENPENFLPGLWILLHHNTMC